MWQVLSRGVRPLTAGVVRKGVLALEDGSVFQGELYGRMEETSGEVVFNTSMTGYQEVLTDPSYRGQIVTMTYPLIGNYGINLEDRESAHVHARGLIVRELCEEPNYWRSGHRLGDWLSKEGTTVLAGIDTRALTRRIREHGTMRGVVAPAATPLADLIRKAQSLPDMSSHDFVHEVTCRTPRTLPGSAERVVVIDFGAKENIIRMLSGLGCQVTVVPAATDAKTVLGLAPDGVMLSNGPGDPKSVPYAVETVKGLLGKVPIFGICLGHQILALALGGDTYKLKFGHRGGNHPVKELGSGRVFITAQNHEYAVNPDSLDPRTIQVTHVNLNDGTVEGLAHQFLPAFSVQYHPEAAPGPKDSEYLFTRFLALMGRGDVEMVS
jgi:carbamoyl-phosphate synthase small subunit